MFEVTTYNWVIFLIHSADLCLLIGVFRPLIFKIIIGMLEFYLFTVYSVVLIFFLKVPPFYYYFFCFKSFH